MKKVTIFCDGSSLGNPGPGGWCAIITYLKHKKTIFGSEKHTTNNRMELTAVIESLKYLKEPCRVEIVSDSKYVCDGISLWLEGWKSKNFKAVKNVDLWEEYLAQSKAHKVETYWVKGHNGHKENEECDRIAKAQAYKVRTKAQYETDTSE